MQIELDPFDLKPEFTEGGAAEKNFDQAINTRDVTFDKLNDKAQQVVRAAGRAVFYAFDRMTYNAVHPPAEAASQPFTAADRAAQPTDLTPEEQYTRAAILSLLDSGLANDPGPWFFYEASPDEPSIITEAEANEERLKFVDAVIVRLREKFPAQRPKRYRIERRARYLNDAATLYWNRDDGWRLLPEDATVYTEAERLTTILPEGGCWVLLMDHLTTPEELDEAVAGLKSKGLIEETTLVG